jgi:hypothetical protein
MPTLPGVAGGFQSLAGVLAEGIIQLNPASLKM